ncbi:MAG: response regulator [Litoreibacter sp.]|nr:response regulator [Litoreibacter sp.]
MALRHTSDLETPASAILLIEDDTILAMDLSFSMSELGYRIVAVARTSAEALFQARSDPPDLIVADVVLADGSSGVDAVTDILSAIGSKPVIYITAHSDKLNRPLDGIDGALIEKPVQTDRLREALTEALRHKAASG